MNAYSPIRADLDGRLRHIWCFSCSIRGRMVIRRLDQNLIPKFKSASRRHFRSSKKKILHILCDLPISNAFKIVWNKAVAVLDMGSLKLITNVLLLKSNVVVRVEFPRYRWAGGLCVILYNNSDTPIELSADAKSGWPWDALKWWLAGWRLREIKEKVVLWVKFNKN